MARAKRTCPSEHDEQVTVIQWAKAHLGQFPCLRWLYACPNGIAQFAIKGGRRVTNYAAIQYFKNEGLNSGVADLCLPYPRGAYHGWYCEMKKRFGGTVLPEQQEFMAYARAQGYYVTLAEGADAAIASLEAYLALPAFGTGVGSVQ